jgi:hypothetical protein
MLSQKYLALNQKLSLIEPNKKAHLISYLPERMRSKLTDPQFPEKTLSVVMTPEKLQRRVDVSHFKAFIDNLPDAEKTFYISAFPAYKRIQLDKDGTYENEFKSEKFSHFVLNTLFSKALKEFPAPTILPYHPTIELLSDSGIALSKLIHYLGLIDIAAEVKKIISQDKLKQLQSEFDGEEVDFMNKISKKERPILSQINLSAYDGNKDLLNQLITNRGLYRFVQGIKKAPAQYRFFFTYFLPKNLSEQMTILLAQKPQYARGYRSWEEDTLYTWRFLCTYSK